MSKKITRQDLRQAAEKYKNWGKWGPDDEIGTLNYTSAADIVAAASLVRKGKVISLALNFDHTGPQGAKSNYPAMGRTNPIHTMIRTGTDAYSGVLDKRGIRAADDMVTMPLQCGTQWDGLGHDGELPIAALCVNLHTEFVRLDNDGVKIFRRLAVTAQL